MMTWRGKLKARQRPAHYRLDLLELTVRFEVFDDAAPAVTLERTTMIYAWPLEPLRGKTLGQLAWLFLNEGLRYPIPAIPGLPPPPPGAMSPADPPALRDEGARLLEEHTDGERVLDLPLPWSF